MAAVEDVVGMGAAEVAAAVTLAVAAAAVAVAAVVAVAVDNVIAAWYEDALRAVTEADTALAGRQGSPEAEDASGLDA